MPIASRIAIVGAGNVGATAAYALMLRGLFSDIVLIDADTALAEAQATDIGDANAIARPARIRAGSYDDVRDADIVVLTAGAATHGDETRASIAGKSAKIVRDCTAQAMAAGFDGILVVAANPVDAMAQVAQSEAGLPPERVIGTGTLLDSNRFRQRIAERLNVAPGAVDAMVLGEHGDSEVVAWSTARIGGMALSDYPGADAIDRAAVARAVMRAGYTINHGKGYTSYGVATAIVRICEAIVRDERIVLPVSTRVDGPYGLEALYLSLPCLIGAGGVLQVLTPELTDEERAALHASAAALRRTLADSD